MAESKVKDMGLAEFGRKELELAEIEMPGLMAARKEFGLNDAIGVRERLQLADEELLLRATRFVRAIGRDVDAGSYLIRGEVEFVLGENISGEAQQRQKRFGKKMSGCGCEIHGVVGRCQANAPGDAVQCRSLWPVYAT